MSPLLILGILLVGIAGAAFFAGMETAVVSVNRLRVEHMVREGRRNARILQYFVLHPDVTLGTSLVGTNLCHVVTAVTATSLGTAWAGARGGAVAYMVLTVVVLVFGEYLPKSFFQARPVLRSLPLIGIFRFFSFAFYPVSRVATLVARIAIPIKVPRHQELTPPVTRDALKHLAEESTGVGELTPRERDMIGRVVDMHLVRCRDVMVPAADIVAVTEACPREEILRKVRETRLTRLAVRRTDDGAILGNIHVMDVLRHPDPGLAARDVMRPALRIPGEKPVHTALPLMRAQRQAQAMVTDREGRVVGLITTEDILAQIVGFAGELRQRGRSAVKKSPPKSGATPGGGRA